MPPSAEFMSIEAPLPATPTEQLTQQFYEWEKRGRGWQVSPYPVDLEPPFRPFLFHYVRPLGQLIDDARSHTPLSGLAERVKGWFAPPAAPVGQDWLRDLEVLEPEPEFREDGLPLVEVQVSVPSGLKISRDAIEQVLLNWSGASYPLSFEIIGTSEAVVLQFTCREPDLPQLSSQVQAYFPEAVLRQNEDYLARHWNRAEGNQIALADFGLSHEFMLPLRTLRDFDPDPLTGIVAALEGLRDEEVAALQVLLQPARYTWAESILRALTDWEGKAFFADAPETLPLAKKKIARPLFAAAIRVAAKSPLPGRAWNLARAVGAPLSLFADPGSNELIPLTNDDYLENDHEADFLLRQTHRSGMLLNCDELLSLVHLPGPSVRSAKLRREEKKTKGLPPLAAGNRLVLGENVHAGVASPVTLSPEQRVQHTYVIGASGTGKSTLLLNLIVQDLQNGEGVAVLDPHGDLIDQVLGYVPEDRTEDVVLLDPGDADYPIGFNILSAHSELEKTLLSSDMVAAFRRLSTSWGDQMTSVLGNAVLACLESSDGGTLADLRRFLIEPDFRREFMKTVQDPEVVYFWEKEFPLLAGKPQAPLLTRLDTFLRPKPIRYMVCQKENRLDFAGMMNQGKIFLAKLAQGAIGEENAYLLGSFLVSKFHQLALSRQVLGEGARRPFFLYIDEFHNFVTPSMAQILTGARKYRLGLILAHQDLRQIWNRDSELANAVLSSAYTRVCFRVGDQDAKKLEEGLAHFDAKDLQNLGLGEAVCRMERADYDFNLKTLPAPEADETHAVLRREQVITHSRAKYAARREDIEATLAKARTEIREPPPVRREREPRPRKPAEEKASAESVPLRSTEVEPQRQCPPKPPAFEEALKGRPSTPPPPGRGGQQHKYLQNLIKKWADAHGFRATIEKPILDGLGNVDVALEREGRSFACEVSVTTAPEHEFENVQKCLAAGFEQVLVVTAERKVLARAREFVAAQIDEKDRERVHVFAPEELFAFLEAVEAEAAGTEQMVRGYKVKVKYRPVDQEGKEARRRAVSEVVLKALKRLKSRKDDV